VVTRPSPNMLTQWLVKTTSMGFFESLSIVPQYQPGWVPYRPLILIKLAFAGACGPSVCGDDS
jgi:hypothetical protein